jgi:hypothetical protein
MLETMARAAGRGLPWLGLLAISAGAAYLMTLATATAAPLARTGEATTTAIDRPVSIEPCDVTSTRLLHYAVSNGWLSADYGAYCSS